jgi:hypothetical protein
LLAGSDLAFADAAADANAAYRRGDYAAAIELYRSLAEQGDTGSSIRSRQHVRQRRRRASQQK